MKIKNVLSILLFSLIATLCITSVAAIDDNNLNNDSSVLDGSNTLDEDVISISEENDIISAPQTIIVDEIELNHGFFDYTEKYHLITSKIHVPARITGAKSSEIKQTAKTIYHTLGCSGFARVDMFLTPEGDIYFNEVNTIPGFTTHSRFPGMMRAAGYSFQDVVDQIIEGGLQK